MSGNRYRTVRTIDHLEAQVDSIVCLKLFFFMLLLSVIYNGDRDVDNHCHISNVAKRADTVHLRITLGVLQATQTMP